MQNPDRSTMSPAPAPSRPWYRELYVWLLIALPATALIAGAVTLFLALHGADIELPHPG